MKRHMRNLRRYFHLAAGSPKLVLWSIFRFHRWHLSPFGNRRRSRHAVGGRARDGPRAHREVRGEVLDHVADAALDDQAQQHHAGDDEGDADGDGKIFGEEMKEFIRTRGEPVATTWAAPIRRRIGATKRPANHRPMQPHKSPAT